jgi:transcriptional regulator with XRE-family HTH domain
MNSAHPNVAPELEQRPLPASSASRFRFFGTILRSWQASYENGKNRVGASRISQIAVVLNVPLATLFDGSMQAGHTPPDQSPQALLAKPQALRLITAFHDIPKDHTRMAILRLIEALGS